MKRAHHVRLTHRILLLAAAVSIGVAGTAYAITSSLFVSGRIDGLGPFHDQTGTLEIYELIGRRYAESWPRW